MKMFRRTRKRTEDERLDRLQREVFLAASASEQEIAVIADSPDLYESVRLRIAAGEQAWARPRPRTRLIGTPLRWSFAAAVVLILIAVAALLWLPRTSRITTETAPLVPQTIPVPPTSVEKAIVSSTTPTAPRPHRASNRRLRS